MLSSSFLYIVIQNDIHYSNHQSFSYGCSSVSDTGASIAERLMIFLVLFPYLICGFMVLNQASICLCQARLGYIHCTMKWDGKLMKSSVIRSLLCHQVYLGNSHESVFSALLAFFMENPLIGWLHIQRVSMAHRFCDTKLWILLWCACKLLRFKPSDNWSN